MSRSGGVTSPSILTVLKRIQFFLKVQLTFSTANNIVSRLRGSRIRWSWESACDLKLPGEGPGEAARRRNTFAICLRTTRPREKPPA